MQPTNTLSILARNHSLRDQLKQLTRLKAKRCGQLKALQTEEKTLCADLGMPQHLMASLLPSEEELNELDQHLHMLRREKVQ